MNNLTVANFSSQARKWFGELPTDWSVNPLKFVVTYNDETLSEDTDLAYEIEYADISSVELGKGIKTTEFMYFEDAPSRARRVVKNGDTLISTVRTYLKAITTVEHAPDNLIASTGFAVLRPLPLIDPNYLGYFTTSSSFVDAVVAQSKGVSYPATNASDIVKLNISFPKLDIQKAIANFLDEKTAHIDALIEKKRKLLEFLAENRAAIITNAVTKGINPDAPMKDSGIDWLGQIPEHWGIRRLKDVGKLVGGAGFPHDEQGFQDEELPFYKVRDLVASSDGITMGKPPNTISYKTAKSLRASIVPTGSILYAKIGAALLLNRRRISAATCCIDNNMTAYVPKTPMPQTKWAYYWLCILNFKEFMNPGAVPSFSEGYQSTLPIALPPALEQKCITDFLDEKTTHIDALIEKNRNLLELFTEYRSALITNAVTGKIKVV